MRRRPSSPAAAALVVAVASASTAGPLLAATSPTSPAVVGWWRLLLAVVALAPLGVPELLAVRPSGRRLAGLAAAGVALGLHFLLWISSLRFTNIAPAVTLANTAPLLLVPMEYWAFGRLPRRAQWPGLVVGLVGAAVMGGGAWAAGPRALAGDAMALGGAATYAAYLLAGRRARATLGAAAYNTAVFAVAAAVLGIVAALRHATMFDLTARTWALLAALSLGPTLLGHALANYSLGFLSATTVALAMLMEPVGASLLGFTWLHQGVGPVQLVGGVAVVAGLALYLLGAGREASPREAAGPEG